MKKRLEIGTFPVIVQNDDSGFLFVSCPVLAGCYSQGKTLEDALRNITEAIELCLEEVPPRKRKALQKRQVSMHVVSV
jgi:predicted RNase H-like HicB family nuclease